MKTLRTIGSWFAQGGRWLWFLLGLLVLCLAYWFLRYRRSDAALRTIVDSEFKFHIEQEKIRRTAQKALAQVGKSEVKRKQAIQQMKRQKIQQIRASAKLHPKHYLKQQEDREAKDLDDFLRARGI